MALIGYQQVQRLLFNNSRVCSNQYLRWKSGHSSEKKNEQKRVQAIAQQKVTLKFVSQVKIAVKENGNEMDPERNKPLKKVMEEALASKVPKETIQNAIKGSQISDEMTAIFEVRGIGRTCLIIEMIGKSKNSMMVRLNTNLKKFQGGIIEPGLLPMFERKGMITVNKGEITFDEAENIAIEVGAESVEENEDDDEILTFICDPNDFSNVNNEIVNNTKLEVEAAEIKYIPTVYTEFTTKRDKALFIRLIKGLEEAEDILSVHHNAAI